MSTENMGIEDGMKAYGSEGEQLGTVSRVWADVEEAPTASEGYLQVNEGGFLGIGETRLYIPFGAVEEVIPGESVTVSCTKEQCADLYVTKPLFIKKKEEQIMQAEAAVIASTTPVIFH